MSMMSVLYVSAVNIFKIKLFVSVICSGWSALIGRLPVFPVSVSANQSTGCCHAAAPHIVGAVPVFIVGNVSPPDSDHPLIT